MPTLEDDSGSDREDELPQVVVLKTGDLTAEEVEKIKGETGTGGKTEKGECQNQTWDPISVFQSHRWLSCTLSQASTARWATPALTPSLTSFSSTGDDAPPDGKILFKKPAKRSSSDKFQGITASSSKKKKSDDGEKKEDEKKEANSGKRVKNNSLLSFGGDEEEEED